jgi:hypothetical protein
VAACKSAKVRDIQKGLNLYLVPDTRTRDPVAETRDLRMHHTRSKPSGLRFPFESIGLR